MAKTNVQKSKPPSIEPETPQMEAYLQVGYPDMSVKKAEAIIKERAANPALYPYEVLQRAEAFLAAYRGRPVAVSTKQPMLELEQHN